MRNRHKIHFLHIRKTGGSAIKSALKNYTNTIEGTIVLHGHKTRLSDIREGDKVFFFLRDPISRFISGFYSRQRKGRPRNNIEWTNKEKKIFETFRTPNEIACGLADGISEAIEAMGNIKHFQRHNHWYCSLEYFQSRIEDVLFIGFQETLDMDFATLRSVLGIHESCVLPTDDIGAHRNPLNLDTSIEERGILALKDWYKEDVKFISLCKEVMSNKALQRSSR